MSRGKVVHVLGNLPYDVYVGRENRRHGLKGNLLFENPLRIGVDGTRDEVLRAYEAHMRQCIAGVAADHHLVRSLRGLRGKTLACWCAPKDRALTAEDGRVCHAQVLLELAEELS